METIEALKQLGFVPSDDGGKYLYDFGNFEISAYESMNRQFVSVIYVAGVYYNGRVLCDVEMQLPLNVASTEQTAAFIVSGIERQIDKNFTPDIKTDWLEIGRNNYDLLPWVMAEKRRVEEGKIYAQRPKCLVEREWLKLAIRELNSVVDQLNAKDLISITFQNGILSIRSSLKVIAFPAIGKDWDEEYKIPVRHFTNFPKRINYKEIEISIWEDYLVIGHWRYRLEQNKNIE